MSTASDPELLAFCAELLDRHGGLLDAQSGELIALLPANLARELEIPEEVRLGPDNMPLLYGSPLLDRLVGFATRDVPVAYGQIQIPYLKKAGFEQLFGQDIVFADGLVRITGRAEARTTYMILICHYLALSDERKEGLVEIGIHEGTGAVINGLQELASELRPEFYQPGKVPSHFPIHLGDALNCGMHNVKAAVREQLSDFLSSMERRLQRDTTNTREYYEALADEMKEGLSHPNLTEAQKDERSIKISELPAEMSRKIEDLGQKYQVHITITTCAALRFLVDVVQLMIQLKHRKLKRSMRMIWNPITRRLDPLVCEHCRGTIDRIHPTQKGSDLSLLCWSCAQSRS